MKKSRFTDSQIIAILKQQEAGIPIAHGKRGACKSIRSLSD